MKKILLGKSFLFLFIFLLAIGQNTAPLFAARASIVIQYNNFAIPTDNINKSVFGVVKAINIDSCQEKKTIDELNIALAKINVDASTAISDLPVATTEFYIPHTKRENDQTTLLSPNIQAVAGALMIVNTKLTEKINAAKVALEQEKAAILGAQALVTEKKLKEFAVKAEKQADDCNSLKVATGKLVQLLSVELLKTYNPNPETDQEFRAIPAVAAVLAQTKALAALGDNNGALVQCKDAAANIKNEVEAKVKKLNEEKRKEQQRNNNAANQLLAVKRSNNGSVVKNKQLLSQEQQKKQTQLKPRSASLEKITNNKEAVKFSLLPQEKIQKKQQEKIQKKQQVDLLENEVNALGSGKDIEKKAINQKLNECFKALGNKTIEQEHVAYIVGAEKALDYEKIANRFIAVRNFLSDNNNVDDFITKNFNEDFYLHLSTALHDKIKSAEGENAETLYKQHAIFTTNLEDAIKNKTVKDLTAEDLMNESNAIGIIIPWTTKAWNEIKQTVGYKVCNWIKPALISPVNLFVGALCATDYATNWYLNKQASFAQ